MAASRIQIPDLVDLADWAAFKGYEEIYGEIMKILLNLDEDYAPTDDAVKRSLFFRIIVCLKRASYSDEDNFRNILTLFNQLSVEYKDKFRKEVVSQYKWTYTSRQTIIQIAICKLLVHMEITDFEELQNDPNILIIPSTFNYNAYKADIEALFDEMKDFYPADSQGGKSEELGLDLEQCTKGLINVRPDKKKAFSRARVLDFLEKNRIESYRGPVITFVRNIETMVLPVPSVGVTYAERISEDNKMRELMRSAQKPDWTMAQRNSLGPYGSTMKSPAPGSAAKAATTASVSTSAQKAISKDSRAPVTATTFAGSVASAENQDYGGNDGDEMDIFAPGSFTISTATSSAMAAAATCGSSSRAPAVKSTVSNFNKKYAESDPLNNIATLVDGGLDAYQARMSTEGNAPNSASRARANSASSSVVSGGAAVPVAVQKGTKRPPIGTGDKVDFDDASGSDVPSAAYEDDEGEDGDDDDDDVSLPRRKGRGGGTGRLSNSKKQRIIGTGMEALRQLTETAAAASEAAARAPRTSVGSAAGGSLTSDKKKRKNSRFFVDGTREEVGRTRWTFDEEEALIEGTKIHGIGNWTEILHDPRFGGVFNECRTSVNLKDKWRNLVKAGKV